MYGSIFKWSDGFLLIYMNWDFYEFNDYNGNEDCVCYDMYQMLKWNDFGCGVMLRYVVCEKGFCNFFEIFV